jgi:protein-tyrosine phosphatase
MKKIAFVCLGNICRSPMAEFVMKSLTDQVHIESRATSNWEHGNPIHRGTRQIFQTYDIAYDANKRSIPLSRADFYEFDYLIGMDQQNVRDLLEMAPADCQGKVFPFDQEGVPDPYYTGRFEATYRQVQKGCQDWLIFLNK